ncbi:MAG: rhodanese-like domain-containing protein, partial [Candidatus Dadabacteria bacterium]|nr:rhodanese-like domain-containing protein [Candidatus Dadabacteria bacterium]
MAEYVHPEVLVSTQWVADHINDANIKIVESDEDILLYEVGHIESAIKIDWQTDLQDQLIRDYVDKEKFEQLLSDKGISNDSTVVFYGDKSNWWACYALWVFKLFGHENCLVMNGGRQKWIEEERPLTKDVPDFPKTDYKVSGTNEAIRAFRDDVVTHMDSGNPLIDVRSPKEYSGEL